MPRTATTPPKTPDVNVWLCVVNAGGPHQRERTKWLERTFFKDDEPTISRQNNPSRKLTQQTFTLAETEPKHTNHYRQYTMLKLLSRSHLEATGTK